MYFPLSNETHGQSKMLVVEIAFEVCSFSHPRDIQGSSNLKVGHVTKVSPLLSS